MAGPEGFGERFLIAVQLLGMREGKGVPLTEISRRMAKAGMPVTSASIGRWDRSRPGLDVIAVASVILGVDPGWLAFGDDSQAEPPPGYEMAASLAPKARAVSEPDALEAVDVAEAAEAVRPTRSPAAKPPRRRKG